MALIEMVDGEGTACLLMMKPPSNLGLPLDGDGPHMDHKLIVGVALTLIYLCFKLQCFSLTGLSMIECAKLLAFNHG